MLGLEPLLRARLAEIPGLTGVYGAPDEVESGSARKVPPCLFVRWGGYHVIERAHGHKSVRVDSRWHVVLVLHNNLDPADGSPARADAATLLDAVLAKLLGWRPGSGYGPLALADEAKPPTYRAGVLRFPIAVTSQLVVSGS
ncbi:MAG: hypothetical protein ABTS16_21305 [Candidatus Accumulibacter phosphatis]|uniref:Tail terminator n=1 Tax=Candidatus Accumulibacter contiguus TaxID=2954381 RepID=A0ABX1T6L0_9PROT|nr:hypothetical protein [Candidatus Accumulibacter contiguus]NMQ05290.1 hypothetical protein [Candidatus Accumulibacter contiguus]